MVHVNVCVCINMYTWLCKFCTCTCMYSLCIHVFFYLILHIGSIRHISCTSRLRRMRMDGIKVQQWWQEDLDLHKHRSTKASRCVPGTRAQHPLGKPSSCTYRHEYILHCIGLILIMHVYNLFVCDMSALILYSVYNIMYISVTSVFKIFFFFCGILLQLIIAGSH